MKQFEFNTINIKRSIAIYLKDIFLLTGVMMLLSIDYDFNDVINIFWLFFSLYLIIGLMYNVFIYINGVADETYGWFYKKKEYENIVEDCIEHKYIKEVTCIHEAGHAMVAFHEGFSVKNIIASSSCGNVEANGKNNVIMTAKDFEVSAMIRYGGAAAEEIFLGSIHGGSLGSDTSDFVVAQQFIKNSLILNIERKNKVGLTEGFLSEMEKKSEELYQKAYFIIKENQDVVKRLAEKLEEKERLTEHEIKELIQENVIESV